MTISGAFLSRNYIKNLPDDVLAQIFDEALFCDFANVDTFSRAARYHPKHAIRLSHVCRRFHLLMTEDTRFWDWPCNRHEPRELVQFCIRNSKELGLRVEIDSKRGEKTSLRDFLDTVTPYQGRWKSLTIDLRRMNDKTYDILKTRFQDVQPTQLEELKIVHGRQDLGIDEADVERGPQCEFLLKARLPRLRRAEFINCIPLPFSLAAITDMDIEFGSLAPPSSVGTSRLSSPSSVLQLL